MWCEFEEDWCNIQYAMDSDSQKRSIKIGTLLDCSPVYVHVTVKPTTSTIELGSLAHALIMHE